MKRRFTALLLIFAVVNLVYFIIWLEDIRQILTFDGMLGLLISLFCLFAGFGFKRMSICTNDDSIIHSVWLSRQMELQYRGITKVYSFSLLPDSFYVVEGKAGNKSARRHIPVFIDGWTDILRTVVSKVDAKIVDRKVLKMLGCEAPVTYLGCEAPITCNGNSVSHEKSNLPLMILTHLIRFVQNLVILTLGNSLSIFISKFVIPNHPRIIVFTIYPLILIVTFFLIATAHVSEGGYTCLQWLLYFTLVLTRWRQSQYFGKLHYLFLPQWLLVAHFHQNSVREKRLIRRRVGE